jgi:hypothetical protein
LLEHERPKIVNAFRAANSAASRYRVSVNDFRNILVITTLAMIVVAAGIAIIGFFSPRTIPLCFQPEKSGQTLVVCPTGQSILVASATQSGSAAPDVDSTIKRTVGQEDLFIIEIVGLAAASVAAANTIRALRSSPDPWRVSVALAALKLPTGALTAPSQHS